MFHEGVATLQECHHIDIHMDPSKGAQGSGNSVGGRHSCTMPMCIGYTWLLLPLNHRVRDIRLCGVPGES
ncbi:hypothetical protein HaLaN_18963 [Haematococcus lacustris]|uniref:Uncharacterized protein n=1 Tax=Haematococcus lacustris TaxID=44745 RepID=A0A699ZKQ3_HAELA|nr:hypothetical protein HaLaN_18963 [Haematococcus lacustris]